MNYQEWGGGEEEDIDLSAYVRNGFGNDFLDKHVTSDFRIIFPVEKVPKWYYPTTSFPYFGAIQIDPLEQEGCYCKRGTVLQEETGACVAEEECDACQVSGVARSVGDRWDVDKCSWCKCMAGVPPGGENRAVRMS